MIALWDLEDVSEVMKLVILLQPCQGACWGRDASDHSQGVCSQRLTVDLGQLLIRFSDFSPCVCRRRWTPTEEMLQHSELFKGKLLKISLFFDNSIYPGYMQPSTFFYPLLTSSTFSNQVFIPFLLAGRKRAEDLPSIWISSLLLQQISFLLLPKHQLCLCSSCCYQEQHRECPSKASEFRFDSKGRASTIERMSNSPGQFGAARWSDTEKKQVSSCRCSEKSRRKKIILGSIFGLISPSDSFLCWGWESHKWAQGQIQQAAEVDEKTPYV